MFKQNFIKLSSAVHELSCSQSFEDAGTVGFRRQVLTNSQNESLLFA